MYAMHPKLYLFYQIQSTHLTSVKMLIIELEIAVVNCKKEIGAMEVTRQEAQPIKTHVIGWKYKYRVIDSYRTKTIAEVWYIEETVINNSSIA